MTKKLKPSPFLLDCTLRDGSYPLNFKFTAKNTKSISFELDKLGFNYIEVGHGMGLGASRLKDVKASASDLDYMKAASAGVKKNKWGVFCIPGIAKLDDLRSAADCGAKFIRIGSDIENIKKTEGFIKLAKKLNLEVFANFMKSYTSPPKKFSLLASKSISYGADAIYIVDSSGGMTQRELTNYILFTKDKIGEKKIGFHGHNNLGLAVANSLRCYEENIFIIDTTLQGIGRSSGNTPSEQFICALIRNGYDVKIDPIQLMNASEIFIRPLIKVKGISSLDTVSGLSQFHSSYMPIIIKNAFHFGIDPKEIIIELCKKTKNDAPINLIKSISKRIQGKNNSRMSKMKFDPYYFGSEQK